MAFSAPTPQPVTKDSSVPYSDTSYNRSQASSYHFAEGQHAVTLSDFYQNGSTSVHNHLEQYRQPTSGDKTSHNFNLSNTREIRQESHWTPTSCNGTILESNPATPPGLDGSGFQIPRILNFPEEDEMMQRIYSAVPEFQVIYTGFTTPRVFPYGSDSSFHDTRFISPANQEAIEQRNDVMVRTMSCLKPSNRAASTDPSSPVTKRRKLPADVNEENRETRFAAALGAAKSQPRRRKTKANVNGIGKSHVDNLQSPVKKGKSSSVKKIWVTKKDSTESPSSETDTSYWGDRKGRRQNLTDEQRKQNHIHSEQRRRNAIKDSFDTLQNIVPGLGSGAPSKATQVDQAVAWLEKLLNGNRELERRLSAL